MYLTQRWKITIGQLSGRKGDEEVIKWLGHSHRLTSQSNRTFLAQRSSMCKQWGESKWGPLSGSQSVPIQYSSYPHIHLDINTSLSTPVASLACDTLACVWRTRPFIDRLLCFIIGWLTFDANIQLCSLLPHTRHHYQTSKNGDLSRKFELQCIEGLLPGVDKTTVF